MSSLDVILTFVFKNVFKDFSLSFIHFFVKKVYLNFDVFWNPFISKSIHVKVLNFYSTVALCTVNTIKKSLYLIGVKRYDASKKSYCAEKRAINNTPTVIPGTGTQP